MDNIELLKAQKEYNARIEKIKKRSAHLAETNPKILKAIGFLDSEGYVVLTKDQFNKDEGFCTHCIIMERIMDDFKQGSYDNTWERKEFIKSYKKMLTSKKSLKAYKIFLNSK